MIFQTNEANQGTKWTPQNWQFFQKTIKNIIPVVYSKNLVANTTITLCEQRHFLCYRSKRQRPKNVPSITNTIITLVTFIFSIVALFLQCQTFENIPLRQIDHCDIQHNPNAIFVCFAWDKFLCERFPCRYFINRFDLFLNRAHPKIHELSASTCEHSGTIMMTKYLTGKCEYKILNSD